MLDFFKPKPRFTISMATLGSRIEEPNTVSDVRTRINQMLANGMFGESATHITDLREISIEHVSHDGKIPYGIHESAIRDGAFKVTVEMNARNPGDTKNVQDASMATMSFIIKPSILWMNDPGYVKGVIEGYEPEGSLISSKPQLDDQSISIRRQSEYGLLDNTLFVYSDVFTATQSSAEAIVAREIVRTLTSGIGKMDEWVGPRRAHDKRVTVNETLHGRNGYLIPKRSPKIVKWRPGRNWKIRG